jgi:CDK inhibitor PHO81
VSNDAYSLYSNSGLTRREDPVLLCNELGADGSLTPSTHKVESSGRTTISVKEAVQIARDNNFMGLICSSRLLVILPSNF